jgi:hypothetical protein
LLGLCREANEVSTDCQTAQAVTREGGAGKLDGGSGLLQRGLEVTHGGESLSLSFDEAAASTICGQPPSVGTDVLSARPREVVRCVKTLAGWKQRQDPAVHRDVALRSLGFFLFYKWR